MATEEFSKLLQRLGKRCSEGANLNEREVIDLFIERSFCRVSPNSLASPCDFLVPQPGPV